MSNGTFLGSLWSFQLPETGSGIVSPYEYGFDSGRRTAIVAQWLAPGLMSREVDYRKGFDAFFENERPEILMDGFTSMVTSGNLGLLTPGNITQLDAIRASVAASYSYRNHQ